jgi:hypothetical protein
VLEKVRFTNRNLRGNRDQDGGSVLSRITLEAEATRSRELSEFLLFTLVKFSDRPKLPTNQLCVVSHTHTLTSGVEHPSRSGPWKSLSPLVRHLEINSVLLHVNKQICGNYATHTHGKLPRDFKFICLTHMKGYQLVSRPPLGPHRRCTRVRLRCRWPHQLYINFIVRRDYSSPGRTGFTSTMPWAATTSLPVARALPQPCHAPSRRSISRRSVALALAVRLVTASRGATTRRPDCTGSTAPMSCIRTRRLTARLLVGPSHWLSSCVRPLRLVARLLIVQIVLTDKTRIHLRSASVQTYTFFTTGFPRFLSICGARGLLALNQVLI